MVVAVTFIITLKDEASAQEFLLAFEKLQWHVREKEPGTLLYELHQCYHEGKPVPWKYLILERYNSRFDLETIHMQSAAFAAFKRVLSSLEIVEQRVEVFENTELQTLAIIQSSGNGEEHKTSTPKENGNENEARNPLLRKGVLLFGGARAGRVAAYTTESARLGELLATQRHCPVVYGGGTFGIMGAAAKAVKAAGGGLVAVIPRALSRHEASDDTLGDLVYYTDSMSERKSIMFAHANVVVGMPGGIGTFDELLEVLTLFQLNAYRPKIALLNVNGFFDSFLSLLRHLVTEEFLSDKIFASLMVAPTADELMKLLNESENPPPSENNIMWGTRP